MASEKVVWLLGGKSSHVHKSILWDELFPNFSEPDIILINLDSLNQDTLERLDDDKYLNAQQEIFEKYLSGGDLIFITSPKLVKHSPSRFDNYMLSPFKLKTKVVNDGRKVKKLNQNEFSLYFSNLKKFSFYIYDVQLKLDEILKRCNHELVEEIKISLSMRRSHGLQFEEISSYRVTDNSNHILSCSYILSRYPGYRSGQLNFLPPLTEHSIEEMIDAILDGLHLTSGSETKPSWLSNVPIPGISILETKRHKFQKDKIDIEKKIENTVVEVAKEFVNSNE